MLLALHLDILDYEKDEMVYHCNDQAFSIYLVLAGVFASVALPTPEGGMSENVDFLAEALASLKRHNEKEQATFRLLRMRRTLGSFGCTINSLDDEEALEKPKMGGLSPFHLHCEGSYFGDVEVFATPPPQRSCSVRCERDGGKLLQLHKDKVQRLLKDFPNCLTAWRSQASRHEKKRKAKLQMLTEPMDLFDLAKREIQRVVVEVWRRKGRDGATSKDSSRPQRIATSSETDLLARQPADVSAGDKEVKDLKAEVREVKDQVKHLTRQMAQLQGGMRSVQDSLSEVVSMLHRKDPNSLEERLSSV